MHCFQLFNRVEEEMKKIVGTLFRAKEVAEIGLRIEIEAKDFEAKFLEGVGRLKSDGSFTDSTLLIEEGQGFGGAWNIRS